MEVMVRLISDRRIQAGLVVFAVMMLLLGCIAWKIGFDQEDLKAWLFFLKEFVTKNPWTLFVAIVILPGFPFPLTPLLFTAGVVWRQQPVMACVLCLLALSLNLVWTYWLAAGPGRKMIESFLSSSSVKIPDFPEGSHLKLILILKLTPGIPHFLQNYLLGFLRVPFLVYLPISVVCSGVIGSGVVLSGVGMGNGKLADTLTGISLIIIGIIFTQLIRGWLARRKLAA